MGVKILFIIPNLKSGGAEKIVTTIVNLLSKNNEFEIVLLLMNNDEMFFREYIDEKIKIDFLNYTRALDFFIKPLVFISKINFYKPKYIISAYGEINPFVSLFSLIFPKISFIARETSIPSLRIKKTYMRILYLLTYRLYDKVIVQSSAMLSDLSDKFYIPIYKLVLIYNPLDTTFLLKISTSNTLFYEKEIDERLFLYIGTINKNKNVDKVIKLYNKIRELGVNGKLLLIGSGPETHNILKILELNRYNNSIKYLPQSITAPLYLKYADYLIIASDYEGFPNVALEASYFGVPIILSNNTKGGAKEFIVQNINGVIVDFDNTDLDFMHLNFDKDKIREILYSRHSLDIFYNHFVKLLA